MTKRRRHGCEIRAAAFTCCLGNRPIRRTGKRNAQRFFSTSRLKKGCPIGCISRTASCSPCVSPAICPGARYARSGGLGSRAGNIERSSQCGSSNQRGTLIETSGFASSSCFSRTSQRILGDRFHHIEPVSQVDNLAPGFCGTRRSQKGNHHHQGTNERRNSFRSHFIILLRARFGRF